jgi:hypothetical protein
MTLAPVRLGLPPPSFTVAAAASLATTPACARAGGRDVPARPTPSLPSLWYPSPIDPVRHVSSWGVTFALGEFVAFVMKWGTLGMYAHSGDSLPTRFPFSLRTLDFPPWTASTHPLQIHNLLNLLLLSLHPLLISLPLPPPSSGTCSQYRHLAHGHLQVTAPVVVVVVAVDLAVRVALLTSLLASSSRSLSLYHVPAAAFRDCASDFGTRGLGNLKDHTHPVISRAAMPHCLYPSRSSTTTAAAVPAAPKVSTLPRGAKAVIPFRVTSPPSTLSRLRRLTAFLPPPLLKLSDQGRGRTFGPTRAVGTRSLAGNCPAAFLHIILKLVTGASGTLRRS